MNRNIKPIAGYYATTGHVPGRGRVVKVGYQRKPSSFLKDTPLEALVMYRDNLLDHITMIQETIEQFNMEIAVYENAKEI